MSFSFRELEKKTAEFRPHIYELATKFELTVRIIKPRSVDMGNGKRKNGFKVAVLGLQAPSLLSSLSVNDDGISVNDGDESDASVPILFEPHPSADRHV